MQSHKKLVQINTVCNGSTGNIMGAIQKEAIAQGFETVSLYGRRKGYEDMPCEKFGNGISFWIHVIVNTLFDMQGWASAYHTKKMVRRLREKNPDVIHLHNLHGYYLNLPVLFRYLNEEYSGKIFWTFHDCWPITGHCPHFIVANCEKWKTGCYRCVNKKQYPISYGIDHSKENYRWKKEAFTSLKDLTIICPSNWVKQTVNQSFLKDKSTVVISNGIDRNIFYPRIETTALEKYGIPNDKKIILGVASIWDPRKGLKDFLNLAKVLKEDYRIVLVGLSKNQKKMLPANIIGILRTENREELAQIYTRADIFINPSWEETFSLVTVEAMACGTPVIAMRSSAVQELVNEENGVLLDKNSVEDYMRAIRYLESCKLERDVVQNTVKNYTVDNMTKRIVELYK